MGRIATRTFKVFGGISFYVSNLSKTLSELLCIIIGWWHMEKSEEFVMVGIGELLWDLLPEGKQLGGAPANFAYHANQLGNRGVVVSSVGKDPAGEEILALLGDKDVHHMVTQNADHPTGTVTVEMSQDGIPTYTIHDNSAWDHLRLDERHTQLANEAQVVCFGTLAQRNSIAADSIQNFLSVTEPECMRMLDINLRQSYYSRESILKLLEIATVIKLNDEELIVLAEHCDLIGSETEMLRQLEEAFQLDLIILTKGADGSRLYSSTLGDSILHGVDLKVIDTVGAGDSFAAAVATGLCRQMSLQDTHLLATRVAAYVCQKAGATPQLPPLEKLLPT